jgi:hypothetical protein
VILLRFVEGLEIVNEVKLVYPKEYIATLRKLGGKITFPEIPPQLLKAFS